MIQRKDIMVTKVCGDNIRVAPIKGVIGTAGNTKEQFITREKLYELIDKEEPDAFGRVLSFYKFHLLKNGSGWINSDYFDSIESLLCGKYNDLEAKTEFTESDAFISSLSLMKPDNNTLFKCGSDKNEIVYCIREYDEQKNTEEMTMYVPYTTTKIPRKAVKEVYKEHEGVDKVTLIGGGKYLARLNGLLEGCVARQVDTSKLETATWIDAQNMFNGVMTKYIDISFLKGKRIETARAMFKSAVGTKYEPNDTDRYTEVKLALNMSDLDLTECINTEEMFDGAQVELSGSMSDTGNVTMMNEMFASCYGKIWQVTKTLNMSRVVEANRMFCEAEVDGIGPLNSKGIDALKDALDMFNETVVSREDGRIDVSGIKPDNIDTVWNMFTARSIKAIVGTEPIHDPAKRNSAYGM